MFFKKLLLIVLLIASALQGRSQRTQIQYLSGTDKDHTVLWDFFCTAGRNSGSWQKIPVPSCWELQGFGSYHYGWAEDFKHNESGLYKHNIEQNPAWKNKIIRLVFEGSMTDTEVKINGKLAGPIHQGSFYRFKYDITSLLKKTKNLLEVKVDKISSDTSINRAERQADFWVFGGIFRPVYLEILPKQFIDWTAIHASADGSFMIDVYPLNISNASHIEAQIQTLEGINVGKPFTKTLKKEDKKVTLTTQVDNPQTWNPEFPRLYQVIVTLKNASGAIHTIVEKFGFRTVEFKEGNGFFVNGSKVIFKGTNRHSSWPTSGRTMSKALSITDVNLIKDMNMNAVRMSHYPPDAHFLDVCDSLGLFVLDELTGWQKKYDTPVGKKLVKEMLVKDVNHPSIIIWDNGNEGGNNVDLDNEFDLYDPQKRHVIHPWNIFRGTDTQHYKGYDCCAGSLYQGNLPFFPTEMLHGLYDGGHGAGLNDHWRLMMRNPLSAGGFLWVFADEGIVRHDKDNIIDTQGNLAPDGIVGPYREKEASFYTIKEIWSPIQINNEKLLPGFEGTLAVENKYLYTNLNQITFTWKVASLASPGNNNLAATIVSQGEFKGPDIAPQQNGTIHIPLKNTAMADVLYITATDPHNRHIFTWSWRLKNVAQINQPHLQIAANKNASVVEEKSELILSASGVTIKLDKQTGLIKNVKNTASEITLANGPTLAAGNSTFQSFKHYPSANNYVVEALHTGDFKQLKYTLLASGILKLEYTYHVKAAEGLDYIGINFNYPEEKITGVKFLGKGPYRVWKNRMKGGEYNIWTKKYNNTITGETWDYPEFKGYYSDFTWVVIENKEHPFTVYTDTDNLFLRLYTPEKPKGAKNDYTSPPFPAGDISFLHGISAIGTKFDKPENNGPEGYKNKIGAEWIHGILYFDFRSTK